MASKRSAGLILDFFSKRSKPQASSLLTEEIPLVDFTLPPTSSRDENTRISSTNKTSPPVETSNLSNLNGVSEHNLEHENRDEILDVSNNPVDDPDDLIQGIMEFCDGDIDIQRLKSEVYMIYDFLNL